MWRHHGCPSEQEDWVEEPHRGSPPFSASQGRAESAWLLSHWLLKLHSSPSKEFCSQGDINQLHTIHGYLLLVSLHVIGFLTQMKGQALEPVLLTQPLHSPSQLCFRKAPRLDAHNRRVCSTGLKQTKSPIVRSLNHQLPQQHKMPASPAKYMQHTTSQAYRFC